MIKKTNLDYEECQLYVESLPGVEHTKLRTLEDLENSEDCMVCEFKQDIKLLGQLISSTRGTDGKLKGYVIPGKDVQTLVIGSSGSGKSQGWAVCVLMYCDGTKSYIIIDPKGELSRMTGGRLREVYGEENVKCLNLISPEKSDIHINYFEFLARKWLDIVYSDKTESEKGEAWSNIIDELRSYIDILFIPKSGKDITWELVAKNFILAMVIALFEDLTLTSSEEKKTKRRRTTPNMITLGNVENIFLHFSWTERRFEDYGFLSGREEGSSAYKYAKAVINNAGTTRSNYLQFVEMFLREFKHKKIEQISACDDFNILALGEKPQVIFLIYDMSDEVMREFVNKIITQNINKLIQHAQETTKPLKVPIIFQCDEFPMLKPHPVYPNVLATGRGMNIFLHIIIQSYSQLKARYPEEFYSMIDNCDYTFFVGTNEMATAEKFSEELGQTTYLDNIAFLQDQLHVQTGPVVTKDYLMHRMKEGEVFIKIKSQQPIHGKFDFFYKVKEFNSYPEHVKSNNTSIVSVQRYDAPWMHGASDEDEESDDFF